MIDVKVSSARVQSAFSPGTKEVWYYRCLKCNEFQLCSDEYWANAHADDHIWRCPGRRRGAP